MLTPCPIKCGTLGIILHAHPGSHTTLCRYNIEKTKNEHGWCYKLAFQQLVHPAVAGNEGSFKSLVGYGNAGLQLWN